MPGQQQLLFQLLDTAVEKYRAQARKLKLSNYGFRILTLLLAAASTVLLGLTIPDNPGYLVWSRNLALVFSAVGTLVVSLGAFWNLEAYWLKSKVLFARVRALRERCRFLLSESDTLSPEEIADAFTEYRALMDSQIEYWERATEQAASQASAPQEQPKGAL